MTILKGIIPLTLSDRRQQPMEQNLHIYTKITFTTHKFIIYIFINIFYILIFLLPYIVQSYSFKPSDLSKINLLSATSTLESNVTLGVLAEGKFLLGCERKQDVLTCFPMIRAAPRSQSSIQAMSGRFSSLNKPLVYPSRPSARGQTLTVALQLGQTRRHPSSYRPASVQD